jgi:hypothetical protein
MATSSPRTHVAISIAKLSAGVERALAEMAIAHEYARDAGSDTWQFAVEISRLRELGLNASDLRWMVEKGYVIHAREITEAEDVDRKFARGINTAFSHETRFLLTDAGLSLTAARRAEPTLLRICDPHASLEVCKCTPQWDGADCTLYFGSQIVKRFTRPSPNQKIILATFEEEGWPERIYDPLPQVSGIDPKRRLHDSIKWLNRNQTTRLLQFSGDGSGQGVRWQELDAAVRPISHSAGTRVRFAA